MYSTACEPCCFCDRERRGCAVGQFCVTVGERIAAPGCCRLFRTQEWKRRQDDGRLGNDSLVERALQEAEFRYDLLIVFDERRHSEAQLRETLDRFTSRQRAIVIDTTGRQARRGIAIPALRRLSADRPFQVDLTIEPMDDIEDAICWGSRLIKASYFVAIEAGRVITGLSKVHDHLQGPCSRVVHWHFAVLRGDTLMLAPRSSHGVYLTAAYRQMGGNKGKSFFDKLAEYEKQTGWSLSWFVEGGTVA